MLEYLKVRKCSIKKAHDIIIYLKYSDLFNYDNATKIN